MRTWHRWLMGVFAVLLSYWVISGLLMALYDATDPTQVWAIEGGGPGARLDDFAVRALPIPDPTEVAAGVTRALASVGAMPIASVDLRMTGAVTRLEFAQADGSRDTLRRFYAVNGEPMSERTADGNPDDVTPNVTRRNALKSWHRGNIAGLPGQLIGLLTGLGLIALTVTGIWLYFQLWNARRRTGQAAFFWWSRDSLWRRLHRWIAIVAAAFVLNIAISGTILAWGEIQLRVFLSYHVGFAPYPRPSALPPVSAGVLPRDINTMLQTAYQSAASAYPGARIVGIDLVNRGGTKSLVTLGGAQPRILAFDAVSGVRASDWSTGGVQVGNGYFADWHQALKRIHRGDIIGHFSGRYLDMAAGLALLYLVMSSFVLYVDMLTRRRQLGRRGWFWK